MTNVITDYARKVVGTSYAATGVSTSTSSSDKYQAICFSRETATRKSYKTTYFYPIPFTAPLGSSFFSQRFLPLLLIAWQRLKNMHIVESNLQVPDTQFQKKPTLFLIYYQHFKGFIN